MPLSFGIIIYAQNRYSQGVAALKRVEPKKNIDTVTYAGFFNGGGFSDVTS